MTNAERCKKYYWANKEKARLYNAEYRKTHPEKRVNRYNEERRSVPWKHLISNSRRRARESNLEFDLDYEWAEEHWTGKCILSEISFDLKNGLNPYSPSIDRIDNSKGYLKDNCRIILWGLNSLKSTGTDEDIYRIVEALVASKSKENKV